MGNDFLETVMSLLNPPIKKVDLETHIRALLRDASSKATLRRAFLEDMREQVERHRHRANIAQSRIAILEEELKLIELGRQEKALAARIASHNRTIRNTSRLRVIEHQAPSEEALSEAVHKLRR